MNIIEKYDIKIDKDFIYIHLPEHIAIARPVEITENENSFWIQNNQGGITLWKGIMLTHTNIF